MRPFWDPVVVAALGAGLLPILPGLPCPTCGGSGGSLGPNEWQGWRPCPDCNGSGVWTPPDSPVPIGVTSAEPVRVGRLGPQGPYVNWRDRRRNQGWGWVLDTKGGARYPIVLSSVIGEGSLRPLKVVDGFGAEDDPLPKICNHVPYGNGLKLMRPFVYPSEDISSALPFLPGLKPEDTVYLLDGFTASVECPECHGYCCLPIRLGSDGLFGGGGQCPSCLGTGRLSCPFPVDAPDHPCVLEVA